jgi:hypothetical protein
MTSLKRLMALFSICAIIWGFVVIFYAFLNYEMHIEKALLQAFLGVTITAVGVFLWLLKDDV